MWYRYSQGDIDWQPEYQSPENWRYLFNEYYNLMRLGNQRSPEEQQIFEKIKNELDEIDKKQLEHQERDTLYNNLAEELIKSGKPEQVPSRYFLNYHRTGSISGNPYSQYTDDPEGLNWLNPDKFNIHIKDIERNKLNFELKAEKQLKTKYRGHYDENGFWEYERDENNQLVPLSEEEVLRKPEPYEITLALFHNGKIVGFAADEFGASGVYLQKPYQGMGLGTLLLHEFLKITGRLQRGNKMGQMTSWGSYATKNLHKQIVEEALQEGKNVPEKVLNEYLDLKEKYVV